MSTANKINKDLILREKLALQRTVMANQTTFLSFLRTSMYFLVAGLSVRNLMKLDPNSWPEILFYVLSGVILATGVFNYFFQRKKIKQSEIHIGDFKTEYLNP